MTCLTQAASLSVLAAAMLAGCANTEQYLHSEPATHFPTTQPLAMPTGFGHAVKLRCIEGDDAKDAGGREQCRYLSADVADLAPERIDRTKRDQIVAALLGVSDLNCSKFLQRAFANRAAFDFGKKLTQDLTTAASAATASASAPVSAVLDGLNLVIGKSVESFNATYYFDKTFQAMEAAIEAERSQRRALIAAKQADADYSLAEAIADVRGYDDACSIKAGLRRLLSTAEEKKNESEGKKILVRESKTPMSTYRNEFVNRGR